MLANLKVVNVLSQVDHEGPRQIMLDEIIIDYQDNQFAIKKDDGDIIKMMTKGWEIYIQWKDGLISWVASKDIKNMHPIKVAKYAIANKIEESVLSWWVPYMLCKGVVMTASNDVSHAANKATSRLYTSFLIFLNKAPIIWYSKK